MPDEELKQLLEETLAVAKENRKMLRAIRRDAWLGFIGKLIWWAIIIFLPLYLYSAYLAPLVSQFSFTSAGSPAGAGAQSTTPNQSEFQRLLDQYLSQ